MTYYYNPEGSFMYTINENNNYHSFNDQPAIIHTNHNTRVWMKDNVLHRDYKKGPALNSKNDGKIKKFYIKDGEFHHPTKDAFTYGTHTKLYYNGIEYNEFHHNDSDELHGFLYANINGKWKQEIWVDGKKIDYKSLPVIINRNENEIIIFGYDYKNINNSDVNKEIILHKDSEEYITLSHNNKWLLNNKIHVNKDDILDVANKYVAERNIKIM